MLTLKFIIDLRNALMDYYCTSAYNAHEVEETILFYTISFKKWVTLHGMVK
jgi:hypothetical protein